MERSENDSVSLQCNTKNLETEAPCDSPCRSENLSSEVNSQCNTKSLETEAPFDSSCRSENLSLEEVNSQCDTESTENEAPFESPGRSENLSSEEVNPQCVTESLETEDPHCNENDEESLEDEYFAGSSTVTKSQDYVTTTYEKLERWQVLGFVDAELTRIYLDTENRRTHKLCVHPQFNELFKEEQVQRLYYRLKIEYDKSFDYVEYKPIPSYSNPTDYEFGLFTVTPCEDFTIIPGVVGFVETIPLEDITPEKKFSVLEKSKIFKKI